MWSNLASFRLMKTFFRTFTASLAFVAITALAAQPSPDRAKLDRAFTALAQLQYGQDRAPLAALEQAVRAAQGDRALRGELERRLIRLLHSEASTAAKDFTCRALKLVGSAESVSALAELLSNPELAGLARYALESMPEPAVDRALRDALPKFQGRLKIGVISSLGARRDGEAVRPLAGLLKDPDAAVAEAAAFALGKIGGGGATRALSEARGQAGEPLRTALTCAYLDCGYSLLEQGQQDAAARVFDAVFEEYSSGHFRLASFQGLVVARPAQAQDRLLKALAGGEAPLRNLAARLITEGPGRETPRAFLDALPKLPPEGQVALLNVVRTRKDPSARAAVVPLVESPAPAVHLAALETLAVVGDARDVPKLAEWAGRTGPSAEAARKSLATLPGREVNTAIAAALEEAAPPVRSQLLRSLGARSATDAAGAVLKYTSVADEDIQRTAFRVLGDIGDEQQVPALLRQLSAATSDDQRERVATTLESICGRSRERAADGVLNAYHAANAQTRLALLPALSRLGGARALEAVQTATREGDAALQTAAIRALAEWAEPAAAPELARLARDAADPAHRVLAFRGYVRLGRDSEAPVDARLKILNDATGLARTSDERRMVLGALGSIPGIESLRLVARSLNDPDLADEAGTAAVKIAASLDNQHGPEAAAILEQVIKTAKSKEIQDGARRQIRGLGR
jgi:HEAT repeat protein